MAPGWFAPPKLDRPDLDRRARALWMLSWPLLGVVTALLGVAVIAEPDTLWRRATTVAAVAGVMLIVHAVSRAGRPVVASWILVIGLSFVVTQRAWITGGIDAPVAVFYALFIVMAGILLGSRGGFVTAAVCFAGAVLLTAGTAARWLTPRPGAGSPVGGLVFVALTIGMALLVQFLVSRRQPAAALSVDHVQMLVHDMRSPLQVMLMHLDLLRADVDGELRRDVEGAIGGATTLNRMANSLLDVSRLEAGRMPVRAVLTDLSSLAHSVVGSVRVLQPDREVTVERNGDPACHCDPELTRRIIENLVSNAMKHTETGKPVRVVLSGTKDSVSVTVIDEGPGVAPEKRARLFELFSADGLLSATGHESSGLGLAFCRLAAEAQGGSIRLDTGTPRGSRFTVELPRKPS